MTSIQLEWRNIIDRQDAGKIQCSLPVTIGRDPQHELQLDRPRMGVSRHHAQLDLRFGQICISDLNSVNGVFIDKLRIQQAHLQHGQSFLIGAYQITMTKLVRCANENCGALLDQSLQLCIHCGHFLADALTRDLYAALKREMA